MADNPNTPAAKPAEATASKTKPYRVKLGKHYLGKDEKGSPKYARQGEIVQLTEEQAQRFKGKFAPAWHPPEGDTGEKAEAKAG